MPTGDAHSSGHLVLSNLGRTYALNVETSDTQSYITPTHDIFLDLTFIFFDLLLNIGFHRTSATGEACRQGMLTHPDTWSIPFETCVYLRVETKPFPKLVMIFPD